MFEEARSLAGMMKMRKISQSEMAKILGVSQSYIANKLRLLRLDSDMQKQILSHGLSERHARAILKLNNKSEQQTVLDRACIERLSVARTEALVDLYHCAEAPKIAGKADAIKNAELFLDNIKNWLDILSSAGIKSRKKTSYDGDKIYVIICLNFSKK